MRLLADDKVSKPSCVVSNPRNRRGRALYRRLWPEPPSVLHISWLQRHHPAGFSGTSCQTGSRSSLQSQAARMCFPPVMLASVVVAWNAFATFNPRHAAKQRVTNPVLSPSCFLFANIAFIFSRHGAWLLTRCCQCYFSWSNKLT